MRKATDSDFDFIYSIYMDDAVNPFFSYAPMDKPAFKAVFAELMARSEFWIIQDDAGADCGMVTLVFGKGRKSHNAMIGSLAIKPEFAGRGIVKRNLQTLINRLFAEGFKRIELYVEDDNTRAVALYKKLGFTVDGVLPAWFKRETENHYTNELVMSIVQL